MSLNLRLLLIPCLAAMVLAGCSREAAPGDAAPGEARLPPQAPAPAWGARFDLAWVGVLPCADCDGIQTRLRLLSDDGERRYELQETYLGPEGGDLFEQQGEWVEEGGEIDGEVVVVYRLDPDGPGRWFWLQPDGSLEMLKARDRPADNGIVFRLQRL